MRVRIHWNKETEQWHMTTARGAFIQEFFDCENFAKVFRKVSKKKPTVWEIKPEYLYSEE